MRAADARCARTASRHAFLFLFFFRQRRSQTSQCPGALNAPEEQEVEVEVPLSTLWRPEEVGFSAPRDGGQRSSQFPSGQLS
eukprot:6779734-Prymnesium_polylepis.1